MLKKILIILGIIALLLLVIWLVYRFVLPSEQRNQLAEKVKEVINLPKQQEDGKKDDDQEQVGYGFREGSFIHLFSNLSETELATLQTTENYLYANKVNQICQNKTDQAEKNDCLDNLKIYQASLLNNPDLCRQITKQDICFQNLAVKNNSLTGCEEIKDTAEKDFCRDLIIKTKAPADKDLGLCSSASSEEQIVSCQNAVFNEVNDLNFCSTIVSDLQDRCRSVILFRQVGETGNKNLCQQIPLDDYKEACLVEF